MATANLKNIKIIMGLGNPGKDYEKTRHNAGIILLNQILNIKNQNDIERIFLKFNGAGKLKFKNADYFEYFKINNIFFVKPKTFMNESGVAAKAALKYFKFETEEILIVHDDSDIEIGKYKISFNRGAAGHRGVESIIKSLKTKRFWRLRIGIRPITRISADPLRSRESEASQNADKRRYIRENSRVNPRKSASREKAGLPAVARRAKAGEFVLKNFTEEELENLRKLAEKFWHNFENIKQFF